MKDIKKIVEMYDIKSIRSTVPFDTLVDHYTEYPLYIISTVENLPDKILKYFCGEDLIKDILESGDDKRVDNVLDILVTTRPNSVLASIFPIEVYNGKEWCG